MTPRICCLLVLIFGLLLAGRVVAAQSDETIPGVWTEPQLQFEDRNGFSRIDYMIADPAGSVHVFWSHNPHSPYAENGEYDDTDTAIFYQRWIDGRGDLPRDILLRSQARLPFGAAIDRDGTMHVASVFGGPPCVGYVRIRVEEIGEARSWPSPVCLALSGVGNPDLAVGPSGDVYITYVDSDQEAVVILKSVDGGERWSNLTTIAENSDPETLFGYPRLVVDSQERLHVVWGALDAPDGYPWQSILYARSTDAGASWSPPILLADAHQGEPNLAVDNDKVHVVWNGDAGYQGRYCRVSSDGGESWSQRITLPLPITSGGLQGAPAIVVDSTGTVHILYTDSPRLYYITQRGGVWSRPSQIAGPENTRSTREINYPMLAITEGNQLHATYTRDAQAVYYQQRRVDAPPQPARAFSTQATAAPIEITSPMPEPEQSTPVPAWLLTEGSASSLSSAFSALAVSALLVLLLVIGVLIAFAKGLRR